MRLSNFSVLILFHSVGFLFLCVAQAKSFCKPIPSSPDWPSLQEWQALNSSVSGRLINVKPPGAVCHTELAQYNRDACTTLQSQWRNMTFHAENPISVDYNDFTCYPNDTAACSSEGYPAYVIAAASPQDVQAGVRFAHRYGVRLIVKATGHDHSGRSSGAGALSIWTRNIRGIEIRNRNVTGTGSSGEIALAKIAAGERFKEILTVATNQNLTMTTGQVLDVGIGGWLAGGGHGPVTAYYGLGADQAVEMEVVTADGQFLTINEHQHQDLFWAMRGGGGSTFAIMISVTMRAYPALPVSQNIITANVTAGSDDLWDAIATVSSYVPSLADSGAMGYYFIYRNTAPMGSPSQSSIVFQLYFPGKTKEENEQIVAPFLNDLRSGPWRDSFMVSSIPVESAPLSAVLLASGATEPVPTRGVRLGSWLLDREALESDRRTLAAKFKQCTNTMLLGHMVASPGVRNVRIPGGSNAVNPAWRNAYSHVVVPTNWDPYNLTQQKEATDRLRNLQVPALRDLAPNSGAYVSEADPSKADWQRAFWGDNYPKLLDIKKKWDPTGVFWCKPCVGNELWTTEGGDGIGQSLARVCRK